LVKEACFCYSGKRLSVIVFLSVDGALRRPVIFVMQPSAKLPGGRVD
jgi:hypothetical protein